MKQKSMIILAVTAVAMTAVAAISLSHRDATVAMDASDADTDGKRLFPSLLDHVNDVQTVKVARHDGVVTLEKHGDGWGVAEKSGYPIEIEPLRKMLIAMGEMTKLEPKTSVAANYEQLGVQDPDAEGSKSALITLEDGAKKPMARLILGKERESKGAAATNQRFVRLPGDAQSWLVQGTFEVKEKASDWLEKKILEVKRDRIRSVEITQPDGGLLAVDRPDAKTNDFTLVDIPEGKDLTYPTAAGGLASGLEYVNLEDVEPIDKVDFAGNPGPTARFTTFEGLVVTVTTKDQDGKSWAKFAASYVPPPAAPEKPAAATDAAKPGDAANPTDTANPTDKARPEDAAKPADESKKPDATAAATKSPAEVQKEVADLNERLSKWAFQISTYTRANLGKKKSELLKDKAPPPADPNAPKDPNALQDPNAPKQGAVVLPDSIPPEIQEQIKAHQESIGNKVQTTPPKPVTQTPAPGEGTPEKPKPDADKPAPKPEDHPVEPPHRSRTS
jgi:hypothetical protein